MKFEYSVQTPDGKEVGFGERNTVEEAQKAGEAILGPELMGEPARIAIWACPEGSPKKPVCVKVLFTEDPDSLNVWFWTQKP